MNCVMTANSISNFNAYRDVNGYEYEILQTSPAENNYTTDSTSSYTDLTYSSEMETLSSSGSTSYSPPFMIIEEQPKNQLRFRYKSEKGNHGGFKPVIKLQNCESSKDIYIKATLYANALTPHVYDLGGKQCSDGACFQKLSKDFTAKFPVLSIHVKKRDEVFNILKQRLNKKYKMHGKKIKQDDLLKEVQEELKAFPLNSGILCFEAFYHKNENEPVCEKIFSHEFCNLKSTVAGDLKITRLSSYSGKTEGNEDMILLCEKVKKDNIEIIFYCVDDDGVVTWEQKATFNPADVHHQVAIPFKTPRFKENIDHDVLIKLFRKSDGKSGEPRIFHYIACEGFEGKSLKRKKPNPPGEESLLQFQNTSPCDSTVPEEQSLPIYDIIKCLTHSSDCGDPSSSLLGDDLNNFTFNSLTDWSWLQEVECTNGVIMDAKLDLNSLSLDEKTSTKTLNENPASKIKLIELLKNTIVNIIKERGNNSFLKILPALMSITDENRNSFLHLMILEQSENLTILIKMLEKAPKGLLNQANKMKMTPLHVAINKGLWKIVRILLICGADPNVTDSKGNNCIHLATLFSFPWCLAEVLAPLLGDKRRKYHPEINTLNYEGLAPIHLAVRAESKICTELLIKAKADINRKDGKCGKTPLHFATEVNSDLTELLLSQPEIDKFAEDFNGCPPSNLSRDLEFKKHILSEPKPVECCIEIPSDIKCSNEDSNIKNKEEIPKERFVKILDSTGLWEKLGLYFMDKNEVNRIALMDTTPAKTILNELKKRRGNKYQEILDIFLSDNEVKEYVTKLDL